MGCLSMEMKVHCPACSRALRVPQTASGRKARCPGCKRVFTIPSVDELFDETVSTWIEDDVDTLLEEKDEKWKQVASLSGYKEHRDSGAPSTTNTQTSTHRASKDDLSQGNDHDPSNESGALSNMMSGAASHSTIADEDMSVDETTSDAHVADPSTTDTANSDDTHVVDNSAFATDSELSAPPQSLDKPTIAATSAGSVHVDADAKYPTELVKESNAPHLTVAECSQHGVTFCFDSIHLEHRGFRVSMPIACAFSGNAEREKLVARPMAFIDQSAAAIRTPGEVEDKHATHLLAGQTPSDLLDIMGTINSLPKPFKFPMPYYAAPEHTKESIACTTKRINDDRVACFVSIPDPQVALQWLLHVNGTCGLEYALLKRDVSLLDNPEWAELGDSCRQRLNIWSPFEPKERFVHYISDADFGKKDRGLAGLVITNRRLIYCKYHHRGHVQLDEPCTIHIKTDENFAHLSYESDVEKTKLAKLHLDDLKEFLDCLSVFSAVTIDVP